MTFGQLMQSGPGPIDVTQIQRHDLRRRMRDQRLHAGPQILRPPIHQDPDRDKRTLLRLFPLPHGHFRCRRADRLPIKSVTPGPRNTGPLPLSGSLPGPCLIGSRLA
ncbi:hypothetical protein Aph01nite_74840 [Acrocarpospora phusangensis]|uniref:Uncharacterized protein n=1 Tax=Acrocarpospora phusangensis TaxID=1070424 RepID=A0A919QHI1_9ACTN|nr:hypothetical protein Aph01nite_74840 [Acrocarpospora phusangensis]